MAEEIRHPDGRIEHPEIRTEPTDASFGWILGLVVAATVAAAVVFIVILWLFNTYRSHQAALKKSPFPLAPGPTMSLPPTPRLEQIDHSSGLPVPNGVDRESGQENLLSSYGSTPDEGFIRIPIDRALDFLANKLPHRESSAAKDSRDNGLVDDGESNSGRVFREKPQ